MIAPPKPVSYRSAGSVDANKIAGGIVLRYCVKDAVLSKAESFDIASGNGPDHFAIAVEFRNGRRTPGVRNLLAKKIISR